VFKLAPSILAADFAVLGESIQTVEQAGVHYIHFDVMDGMFVPNLSFGIPVLKGIRNHTSLPFDVHLMIMDPIRYLERFAQAGADILNVHLEAAQNIQECIGLIHSLHKKAAVTIKPDTPVEDVFPFAETVDMILLMSVEPGFGGQAFIHDALRKSEILADFIQKHGLSVDLEMDGGIDLHNLRSVLDAGVNVIVAGSAVFKPKPSETIYAVKEFLKIFHENEESNG